MATLTSPDTLIFKALVYEIQEVDPYFSAIDVLMYMCDDSKFLANDCEYYFFRQDDGQLTEEETFLIEWLRTMEAFKAEELRHKLLDTAHRLNETMLKR